MKKTNKEVKNICNCDICKEVLSKSFVLTEFTKWKVKLWKRHNNITL